MRAVKIAQNIFVGCIFGRFVGCDWWDGAYKMTSFSWFHIWWFYWEQFEGIFFVSLAIKILLPFFGGECGVVIEFYWKFDFSLASDWCFDAFYGWHIFKGDTEGLVIFGWTNFPFLLAISSNLHKFRLQITMKRQIKERNFP